MRQRAAATDAHAVPPGAGEDEATAHHPEQPVETALAAVDVPALVGWGDRDPYSRCPAEPADDLLALVARVGVP